MNKVARTVDRDRLKLLHDTQMSVEKMRIQVGNRVNALSDGRDESLSEIVDLYRDLWEEMAKVEERTEKEMARQLPDYPVWDYWLKHVKGIGPGLGAQLMAMLMPPLADRGPSTWYKAAGLTVEQVKGINRLPRPREGGGKITYYPHLRRCLHNVAESFIKTGGHYREIYDRQKARLTALHADDEQWPKHRLDSVARWATIKRFLADLWEMWMESEGDTSRKAYVIEKLGHHYEEPPRWNGKTKI